MASCLAAADENDNDMKTNNWDNGMYDGDATVATPGPRSHGQEPASGMKVMQATHQLAAANSQAAWTDWMRPAPGSSNDHSKALASKAHQGGALNAAKALQEQEAANHTALAASTKMLMSAAKQTALTRNARNHLQKKIDKEAHQNKRSASIVQNKIASPSQGSPASGNGASTSPMSPLTARQLFRSPGKDGTQWLSPSAAGSGTQMPIKKRPAGSGTQMPMKKRPASKQNKAVEVEEKEMPPKKKKKVDKVLEAELQAREDSAAEHEEGWVLQEGEESEEEIVPQAAEKPTGKSTFAGNRPPLGEDRMELFNLKKQKFWACQAEIDEQNPSPEAKKLNHKVNDQFKYWKHMQEATAQLKKDNADATQDDYRKCFSEAAKSWHAKCVQALNQQTTQEKW